MIRISLLLSLLLIVIGMWGQETVSGRVVDKQTKAPITDVIIQYGAYANDYLFSGEQGRFSITSLPQGSAVLFQSLGYKTLSTVSPTQSGEWIVELEANPLSLAPVIVSPQIADKLLKDAAMNTKKKMVTDENICYLLHFLQWEKGSYVKNEAFVKYVSRLSDNKLKKLLKEDAIPYDLNLVDINHLQEYELPLAILFGAEYHPSHLFTFGDCKDYEVTMSNMDDTTRMAIDISPIAGTGAWAKGQFIISKKDKALLSIDLESVDSIMEKDEYKRYLGQEHKVIRIKGNFSFSSWRGRYYLSSAFSSYRFRIKDRYGNTNQMEYNCDLASTGLAGRNILKKRPLSGYVQEIFYIPNTTIKDFWTDSPDMEMKNEDDHAAN